MQFLCICILYTVSEERIKANAIVLPLSLNAERILSICVNVKLIECYYWSSIFFFFFLVACIAIWSLWFWSLNITKVKQEEQSFNFSTHYWDKICKSQPNHEEITQKNIFLKWISRYNPLKPWEKNISTIETELKRKT